MKPNPYDDYLKQLHEQSSTDDRFIHQAVTKATNRDVATKKRIVAGEINEVYDVTLENDDHVIVRISGEGDEEFRREQWAIQQCKSVGVPVPETILVKTISGQKAICIQRKIDGEPLERGVTPYRSLPEDQLKSYIYQAGSILSRIHTIPTDGFGYVDGKGKGEKQSFTDEMSEHLQYEKSLSKVTDDYDLDPVTMRRIFQILTERSQNIPDVRPVLNHNDYGPKHFMVQDSRIVSIIDFGQAAGHSPINDFARWFFWYDDIPLDWLKEGYEYKSLFDSAFEETLHWIALSNGLSSLWWYVEKKYNKGVDDAFSRLKRISEYF
ncbi:MAG: aminoglycoside phosphotransferase family protein [Candidatus Roizmanbacteria bacterium]|nr:aminoglycoside phosphotransferase family protein [Candidatus Roizmanbacteria bacterium]